MNENDSMGPVGKRRLLNELLRERREFLHVETRRRATSRAVVALVDANPWLNDQIPVDVARLVRAAAKE